MTRDVSSFPVPFLRNGGLSIVLPPACPSRGYVRYGMGPGYPGFLHRRGTVEKGNIVAKASISLNYRFPTLNDLYFLPGGNPDLKSEHGFTYDVGLSFSVGKENVYALSGGINWFDSHIDDWIIWLPTTKGFFSPETLKRYMLTGQRPTPTLI